MFITADALICHAIGDYLIQSDWCAAEKTKKSIAALVHVITYSLPFLFLTTSWKALLFIAGTHFIIDRWRLARYVCWAKNWIAPKWIDTEVAVREAGPLRVAIVEKVRNLPWAQCTATGYPPEKPVWLTVWLMIVADNICHVLLNAVALKWLT